MMRAEIELSTPTDDREIGAFAALASSALGFPGEGAAAMLVDRVGKANLRIARERGERSALVGGLALLPMGHWFGGRVVSCVGVSMLAVAPEHRSRGVATAMLAAALREARSADVSIASLFPATFPLYRAAGFETAGSRFVYRMNLAALGEGAREPPMTEATVADHAALRALYDTQARARAGAIARTPYFWRRVLDPGRDAVAAYVVRGSHGVDGYVVLTRRPGTAPLDARDVAVRDWAASTPEAARRILRFLADHRSIARTVTFVGGPADAFGLVAGEERLEAVEVLRWMLRLVDVRAAVEQRGWSPCVRVQVHLAIEDPVLEENSGRYVLEVGHGKGELRPGGRGDVRIDARGFAALYAGYLPAEELRAVGRCDGAAEELARLTALFAGPAPFVADFF